MKVLEDAAIDPPAYDFQQDMSYTFHFTISFSRECRRCAQKLAELLKEKEAIVFYDHAGQNPNDASNRRVKTELKIDIANSNNTMHMIWTKCVGKWINDYLSTHKHPCGEIHHEHG